MNGDARLTSPKEAAEKAFGFCMDTIAEMKTLLDALVPDALAIRIVLDHLERRIARERSFGILSYTWKRGGTQHVENP